MSPIIEAKPELIASTTLHVQTQGTGFIEITGNAVKFIDQVSAGDGILLIYLRHTSASLAIQENADPDVQADLITALDRLAPENAQWIHDVEGPDDMPAHVKASLLGCSLMIPIRDGRLCLGTWQGIYLCEHRRHGGKRRIVATIWGETEASPK